MGVIFGLLLIVIAIELIYFFQVVFQAVSMISGGPYVRTPNDRIETMFGIIELEKQS